MKYWQFDVLSPNRLIKCIANISAFMVDRFSKYLIRSGCLKQRQQIVYIQRHLQIPATYIAHLDNQLVKHS